MAIKLAFQGKTCVPPEACFCLEVTSPGQRESCLDWAQPIPTPVTRTQAWGGRSASAMALAKVLVVSTRLLMTSLQKASFHLGKGEPVIMLPRRTPKERTAPSRGPADTHSQAQERSCEFLPTPEQGEDMWSYYLNTRGLWEMVALHFPQKAVGFGLPEDKGSRGAGIQSWVQ